MPDSNGLVIHRCFHSIGFPCERGTWDDIIVIVEFKFPFNWFPLREGNTSFSLARVILTVSIQLVSPARGEPTLDLQATFAEGRFPFNWFPLREGNGDSTNFAYRKIDVSIQLVSPARGELGAYPNTVVFMSVTFPFNWFPLREGNGNCVSAKVATRSVSIQLVSPARGELAIYYFICH